MITSILAHPCPAVIVASIAALTGLAVAAQPATSAAAAPAGQCSGDYLLILRDLHPAVAGTARSAREQQAVLKTARSGVRRTCGFPAEGRRDAVHRSRQLLPATTNTSRNREACSVSEPTATNSSGERNPIANLRTFTARYRRVMIGRTTCSREPSVSIASTNRGGQVAAPAGRAYQSAPPLRRPGRREGSGW